MRTTILLSTLLFLAGSALAQDSPITVGDSGSQLPPAAGKKAGTTVHSINLQHKHFNPNGDNYHVQDSGYKTVCFEVAGVPRPLVSLGQSWTLVLSDGVVLTTTDGNRIDIVYSGKQVAKGTAGGDEVHKVVGDQLTSGDLSTKPGTWTTYPASGTTPSKPLTFKIHYCQSGVCPDPNCK